MSTPKRTFTPPEKLTSARIVEGMDRTEILELWAESWRRHGWEPVVHTRAEAAKHPKAGVYDRLIAKLEGGNDPSR